MKNFFSKFEKVFHLFWSFVFLFVVASCLEGIVLYYLWEWFVVPLGLQSVSVVQAIGVCILLDFVTYHYYDYKKSEEVGLATSLLYIIIRPLVALAVGAALHFGMLT